MRPSTDDLDDEQRTVLANIAEYGSHIVHTTMARHGTPYAYTIGLTHRFGHPEIVICGLDEAQAESLLELVTEDVAEGKRFEPGRDYDGLLHGYPAKFRALSAVRVAEYLGVARWAYDGAPFTALQLFWPDKQGRFPWHPDVRERFKELQQVLGEDPAPGGA
ncbi:MAG TPA: DUF4262 domain-containing protein [Planctomycetota bacterium]|nr:DUF4262 domain-containing protein [Planctomycetota bacterium]